MNIEKIKYFIDLVEYRNFTETAKKNFVSQTAISQQIASLEAEFNIQLIDRRQIPIEPTPAGWLFYGEAVILWKQYNHMKSKMENYRKNDTQLLSIEYAKSISKDELYEYPLIMLNPTTIGNSYDLMIQNAIQDGYQPKIIRLVDDIETELFYIITENLIGFLPDNYTLTYLKDDIRLIPLEDTHHTFRIELGYLKDNKNAALKTFLNHIPDLFFQ